MSNYKHSDWFCKPANEAEAVEIIERAVASGAKLYDTTNKNSDRGCLWWDAFYAWGVLDGQTYTGDIGQYGPFKDAKKYTLQQLREMFPLQDEQVAKWGEGLPPVGAVCEVLNKSAMESAPTKKICKILEILPERKLNDRITAESVAVYLIDHGDVREVGMCGARGFTPIPSERDEWVIDAQTYFNETLGDGCPSEGVLVGIYDAIKSGDLKAPEVKL